MTGPRIPSDAIGEVTVDDQHRGWVRRSQAVHAYARQALGQHGAGVLLIEIPDGPDVRDGMRVVVFPVAAEETDS